MSKNDDTFEKTKNKDNMIQNDINEDNMPIENVDNFQTIDESHNEGKMLSSEESSHSSNSNFDSSDPLVV